MHFCAVYLTNLIFLWNYFSSVDSNALLNPTSRGMMWTRSAFNTAGYNYMEINCGGVHKIKQNNGKCGLCGDPFNAPRDHETGGKYATGAITQVLERGEKNLNVKVLLNIDQGGYFEFRICASNGSAETQECFDQHLLKITEGRRQGDELAYIVRHAGIITLTLEIPERLYCEKCVLQWKYVTGNTFGWDAMGKGCLGCGQQDTYINCADITIRGWELPTTPPPPTTPIPTTMMTTTTPSPPTTTKPAPPPSHVVASLIKHNQLATQRHRSTASETPRYVTKNRQTVTDFDEGSRQRFGNGNGNRDNGKPFEAVPAPLPQTPEPPPPPEAPAVIIPVAIENKPVMGVPVQPAAELNPVIAPVQPIETATEKVLRPPRQTPSWSFNIPRPPKLSSEQLDALNNNKNMLKSHDPLQKYVQVGSSKIIASVDFTTAKALQVQTPPSVNRPWNARSTDPTLRQFKYQQPSQTQTDQRYNNFNNEMKVVPIRNQAVATSQNFGAFESFGNEMSGVAVPSPNVGGGLINEYGFDTGVNQHQGPRAPNQHFHFGQNIPANSNDYAIAHGNNGAVLNHFDNNGIGSRQQQMSDTRGGNKHFSMDKYNAVNPQYQHNPFSPRYQNANQNMNPELAEVNMFGNQGSRHSKFSGDQSQVPGITKNVEGISETRYGPFQSGNQNPNPYQQQRSGTGQNQRYGGALQNNKQTTQSTKLPVIDTSTSKDSNANAIAPWRKPPTVQPAKPMPDLTNIPINLFKAQDKKTFKAPVIKERFTNYQIGGGGETPRSIPESLKQAINVHGHSNEKPKPDSKTYNNNHLNAGIHSPENYFGQDHYISHSVEMSNPAFGAGNVEHNQNLNSGNFNKQPPNIPSVIWGSAHAQSGSISAFGTGTNNEMQTSVPLSVSSSSPTYSPSPTFSTAVQTPHATTDKMDLQMQEIVKLREKLEQLQQLIHKQQDTSQNTPLPNPTSSENIVNANSKTYELPYEPSLLRNEPVNDFNQQNTGINVQSQWMSQNQFQEQLPNLQNNRLGQSAVNFDNTQPPSMERQTTHLIENFKAQMLQSIEAANAKRNKQSNTMQQSMPVLRHKQTTQFPERQYDQHFAVQTTYDIPVNNKENQQNVAAPNNEAPSLSRKDKYLKLIEMIYERKQQNTRADNKIQQNHKISNENFIKIDQTPQTAPTTPTQIRSVNFFDVRPYEVLQKNATRERLRSQEHNTPKVTTSMDNLADKIAAGMAKKLKQGGASIDKDVPLSSDSLMSALRKIALGVLKERQTESTMPDIAVQTQSAGDSKTYASTLKTTEANRIKSQVVDNPVQHVIQDIAIGTPRQEIINVKDLTNVNTDVHAKESNNYVQGVPTETAPTSEQQLESYKRRQELINKMKLLMLGRPSHVSNTRTLNNDRPIHLPGDRPSHLGQQETVGSQKTGANNNRPTHIIDDQNNGRQTIYDTQSKTTQGKVMQLFRVHPSVSPTQSVSQSTTSTFSQIENPSDGGRVASSVDNAQKLCLPPNIASSMLHRVKEMLANKNNENGQAAQKDVTTQDVLNIPLNKEMLFKMFKTMSQKQNQNMAS